MCFPVKYTVYFQSLYAEKSKRRKENTILYTLYIQLARSLFLQ
jgi:hypothetical protein